MVDEAYVDFSTSGSAVSLIGKHPNVVVLQTLSKAFGLAGARCGFAIGAPDVIQLMNNVKAPYNVNSLTSEVAINAMDSIHVLEGHVKDILEQREVLAEKLASLSFVKKVYPSDANFLLFRLEALAVEMYKKVRVLMDRLSVQIDSFVGPSIPSMLFLLFVSYSPCFLFSPTSLVTTVTIPNTNLKTLVGVLSILPICFCIIVHCTAMFIRWPTMESSQDTGDLSCTATSASA